MNHLQQAIEFRQTYRQPILEKSTHFQYNEENLNTLLMQINCIQEEKSELLDALFRWTHSSAEEGDRAAREKAHLIKELADLIYVCYQLAAFLAIDIDTGLDRVHTSNMTKTDENGLPIFNAEGKVMKGPMYKKPYLGDLA